MNTRIHTILAFAALAVTASAAAAAIISFAGNPPFLAINPTDCTVGQLTGFNAFACD